MNYQKGDPVALKIIRKTPLGYTVLINFNDQGLLFDSDVYQPLQNGEEIDGYVKKIRDDGKFDVSLRPQGFKNSIDPDCDKIIALLKRENTLFLSDKSSPEEIKNTLQMSKKSFKKAIGFLYKRKVISLFNDHIELNEK